MVNLEIPAFAGMTRITKHRDNLRGIDQGLSEGV